MLDELQFGIAAAEQFAEQLLEIVVDDLERGQKPLARFVVEIMDALAQPPDRFDQIVAFGRQLAVLSLDIA